MNSFEKFIQNTAAWIRENQERFWGILGGAILTLLFIGLVIHHHQTENEDAWSQLGTIQGQLMQGKLEDARKALDSWQTKFQGSNAATYAQFMKADLLYRSAHYAEAAQTYAAIVQSGKPNAVKPLALSAEADSEEMAGNLPRAQTLSQQFLDQFPDHFLTASRYMGQARLAELIGDRSAATAVYERFVLLFPQSPWTALAKTRLQMLGGSKTAQPAAPAALSLPH